MRILFGEWVELMNTKRYGPAALFTAIVLLVAHCITTQLNNWLVFYGVVDWQFNVVMGMLLVWVMPNNLAGYLLAVAAFISLWLDVSGFFLVGGV